MKVNKSKTKKISEMKNLGVAVEKDLNAAGVFFAHEVKKLGVEKTFIKMLKGEPLYGLLCLSVLFNLRPKINGFNQTILRNE